MHKAIGGKLEMGPVWDFDWAFAGPTNNMGGDFNGDWGLGTGWYNDQYGMKWFVELLQFRQFATKVQTRWLEVKAIVRNFIKNDVPVAAELIKAEVGIDRAVNIRKGWDNYYDQYNNGTALTFERQWQFLCDFMVIRGNLNYGVSESEVTEIRVITDTNVTQRAWRNDFYMENLINRAVSSASKN